MSFPNESRISDISAREKVSIEDARKFAHEFEKWAQGQPQPAAPTAQLRKGFGMGFLLKMGTIITLLVRAATSLALGQPVSQQFSVLGSSWQLTLTKLS